MPAKRKAFLLRIDPKLYAELRRWADDELRSLNAQVEFLLRRAVAEQRGAAAPPDAAEEGDEEVVEEET